MPGLLLSPYNAPLDFLPQAHEILCFQLLAIHPVTYRGISQKKSGCADLNRGPPDPQSGALTKLRYSPMKSVLKA